MLPGTAEERSKFGLEAVFRGANGLRVVAEGACPWVHSGRLGLAVEPDVLVTDHLRQQVVVRVVVQRRDLNPQFGHNNNKAESRVPSMHASTEISRKYANQYGN